MRDDIHNKAPISARLRNVLKHALRPADQQRPDLLRDLATSAMAGELASQFSRPLLEALVEEEKSPSMFPRTVLAPASRFQEDLAAHMSAYQTASLGDAVLVAGNAAIESICNESQAAMLAGGGSKNEIAAGVAAFRASLIAALPDAVDVCIGKKDMPLRNRKVTLGELLPLGRGAQKGVS